MRGWILLILCSEVAMAQPSATDVLRRADENQRGKTSESEMVIRTVRPGWSREMTLHAWLKGDDLALLRILSPARDRGVVYLKRKKEVWNWIPALERVIKLPPSMMSQGWMGTALGWNPTDLFQVGNPFDPDYVERPGADAIRTIRSIGPLSGVELAVARTGPGTTRGAWRYFTNRSGYDLQFIAGWLDRQPVFAGGWSGSLGNWSFRGEAQGLIPLADEPHQWQFVLETDRLLSHNNYIRASFLYNNDGVVGGREVPVFSPTPKQLMPGKWNASMGWSQDPSFRLNYGVDVFYTSAAATLVFFPRMEWSFSEDWSASLFIQITKSLISHSSFQAGFIRLEKRISK